jgi:hypothetical protein
MALFLLSVLLDQGDYQKQPPIQLLSFPDVKTIADEWLEALTNKPLFDCSQNIAVHKELRRKRTRRI